jgi:hypothetical protein
MVYLHQCTFTLHRGSRSRCTKLTRRSLLTFFQLQRLVIRHPLSHSPTMLLLTPTNHFIVPFLHSTSFSATNSSSIDRSASTGPQWSSCRLSLALQLLRQCQSTSTRSFFPHHSLSLAIHDVRESFPVASFAPKVPHVPTSAHIRSSSSNVLSDFAGISQQRFTSSHLLR